MELQQGVQRELQVGDRMKDNDPRRTGRELEIIELLADSVKAKDRNGRVVSVLKRRIHTDDKARTKGFTLLKD